MEIMDALWEVGSGSIREIHENLPEKRRPAYTTVQTIIRRLEEKGAVRQTKQVGNAHIFEPAFTREAAHRRLIDELLDLFGGSAPPPVAAPAGAGATAPCEGKGTREHAGRTRGTSAWAKHKAQRRRRAPNT